MTVTFRAATADDREALLAFSTSEPVTWIGPDRYRAEAGEPKVVGTTDAANTPMRRAFERAGFVVTKRRIVFER